MYTIAVKSGTNGYYDRDNCIKVIAEIPSNNIPKVGAIIELDGDGVKEHKQYLVLEVKYTILIPDKDSHYDFDEWIYVYVIDYH